LDGFPNSDGTVFKLKAPAVLGESWTLDVVHDFLGSGSGDGAGPGGGLVLVNGVFYGTTLYGGTLAKIDPAGAGTIFRIAF
jgi:uncharacterized repeat protein (TIGR03803 family)